MTVTLSPNSPVVLDSNPTEKSALDEVGKVLSDAGVEYTIREVTHDGRQVKEVVIDPKSQEMLRENPELLGEVRNSLECCVGSAAGVCVGILVAVCVFAPFAIAGGVVLGIGNVRAEDDDPSNDGQAAEMQLAGKIVLGVGGGISILVAGIYGCCVGLAGCLA